MATAYSFADRREAGRALARCLAHYSGQPGVVVLALPRGGVPVGYEVAKALHAPLDVFAVRKLGAPGYEELAFGAVASGGVTILDDRLISMLRISASELQRVIERELEELSRRDHAYRDSRPRPVLAGKTVIVVDDGLATGSSMRAAVEALREMQAARIVVAAPVGAAETRERLEYVADEVVCVLEPADFRAVGAHYLDFRQVGDEEVRGILDQAWEEFGKWSGG